MKAMLPILILAGVSLFPVATAATTSGDRTVERTLSSLLKVRAACFKVERDQSTSDRCAERVNAQISALADTAITRG